MIVPLALLALAAEPAYAKLFDDTKLHTIHLSFRSEQDYAKLDAIPFPWVAADVEVDGERVRNVAVQRKRDRAAMLGSPRTSLKLSFSKLEHKRRFHGLARLVLNNEKYDPSLMREKLAYDLFRAAGCPASRAAHAEVTFSVKGRKKARELAGVYTLVEHVGEAFLDERFGGHEGDLFKVTATSDLFGQWMSDELIEQQTAPHTHQKKPNRGLLFELVHQVMREDGDFAAWFDVDAFLPCLAANTALAVVDSYAGIGHNFYLYEDPRRGKFVFIPWDLDQSLGQVVEGAPEDLAGWDVFHPVMGEKRLITRVLRVPEHRTRYAEHLHALATGAFSPRIMGQRIRAIRRVIGAAVKRDVNKPFDDASFERSLFEDLETDRRAHFFAFSFGLDHFVRLRSTSILAQLAGLESGRALIRY